MTTTVPIHLIEQPDGGVFVYTTAGSALPWRCFTDAEETHGLWMGNAVLHHRPGTQPWPADSTLVLTKPTFLRPMNDQATPQELAAPPQWPRTELKIAPK